MFLLKFLSLERIENYRRLETDSEKLLLARYLWNIALCEACYPALTLGFWTGLFRKDYAQLWHRHIKEVFPHLSAKHRTPSFVFQHLKSIHSFRNRVFHHEPIWDRTNLLQQYQRIKLVLDWLSPELQAPLLKLERFIKIHQTGENAYLV